MKKLTLIAAGLLVATSVSSRVDSAERPRRGEKRSRVRVVRVPDVISTIQYDTGVNAGFHPDGMNGTNLNRIVGNRFNTLLGGPLVKTNMVTMITVFPANNGIQSVTIAAAPTTMNTAMVLDFLNGSLVAHTFNVIDVDPPVVVGPDFIGFFMGAFGANQGNGLLGMSDMATMGQGYHAVQAFYVPPLRATMIEVVPSRNAMLRVTIDYLPVELMDFKIQ
jgi:hypothetical protein